MQTRASIGRQKYEKATEFNHKYVHLLALKLYDPLVLIVSKLDPNSVSKLARTCSAMYEKVKLMRGVRVPFQMDRLTFSMNNNTLEKKIQKHGVSNWNWTLAAKIQRSIPLFQPIVDLIDVYPTPLTEKLMKNMKQSLVKIKANRVNKLFVGVVEMNAWDGLKTFIKSYEIEEVFLSGEFPEEHQISPIFLHMPELNYYGEWSEEYIKNTTRKRFHFGNASYARLTTIFKRWHSEDFMEWRGRTMDMDVIKKFKDQYPSVTIRQRTRIPDKRPILCEMKKKDFITSTVAILRQDGKVVFVDFCSISASRMYIVIYFAEESDYPYAFKKILGV